MGRRARTNCSPVDAALEKYHSDIGNRLSGLFAPPPATTEGGQPLSEDFCMLTLDLRRVHSCKGKVRAGESNNNNNNSNNSTSNNTPATPLNNTYYNSSSVETPKKPTDNSAPVTKENTMLRSASPAASAAHAQSDALSEQESSSSIKGDKPRLVDKLTRALFQKKHVCARCKRKSRSCLLNKTFNVTEKRYTCGRCRENSSALKNFFDDQSSSGGDATQDLSSFSSLSSSSSPATKPRAGNDSGYETVTSCSTVASSYSAFNTPNSKSTASNNNNNNNNNNRDTTADSQVTSDSLDCQKSSSSPASSSHAHQQDCACQQLGGTTASDPSSSSTQAPPHPAAAHEYDGYLPDFIEFRGWTRQLLRPCSHGDKPSEGCGHSETGPGGVVCVRRPASLDSSRPAPGVKACHTCGTTSLPCFRLPWEGGWICEDCMDGIY